MPKLLAEQLKDTIRELLKAELGSFRAGVLAIAIQPPEVPNTGSGLVVIIDRQPIKLNQSVSRLKVTLKQYDRTERGFAMFDAALDKMRSHFPLSTEVLSPFESDKITQAVFQIDCYQHFTGLTIAEIGHADRFES